jgi:hypothetical protein
MAETDVIREFLVSIGYKVDGSTEQKFKQSVETATKLVAAMAAAAAAMAVAVEAAIVKTARQFDQLYWSTQRVGASAANVKAFGYALSQVGGSADAAQASVEKFASSLRTNPGYGSWLKDLGVATTQGGKARDTIDEMISLVDTLSKRYSGTKYGIGASIAAQFGIDEQTYFQIINNRSDFEKRYRESKSTNNAFGFDPDKAAKTSKDLIQQLDQLANTLSTLKDKMLVEFGPGLKTVLQDFEEWVKANKDQILAFFEDLTKAVGFLSGKLSDLVSALKPVWDEFDQIAKKLTGQDGVQVAFEAFAVFMAARWLPGITATIDAFFALFSAEAIAKKAPFLGLILGGTYLAKQGLDALSPDVSPGGERSFADSKFGQWLGGTAIGRAFGLGNNSAPVKAISNAEQMKNARSGYAALRAAGFTPEMAIGVLANVSAESGFNPASRGDGGTAHGIAQWHSDRRAAILSGTGIDVSNASFDDQIKAIIWEMQHGGEQAAYKRLLGAGTAEEAAAITSQYYERPADVAGAISDRVGRAKDLGSRFSDADLKGDLAAPVTTNNTSSVSNSLTSTVNLYGDYDGKATGDEITSRINGSWDLLMRNGQSAVR